MRLALFLAALLLCILLPFALWGDALDRAASDWWHAQDGTLLLALLGIVLLVADVVLPIPSSLVGMGLCWALGPVWGGISLAVGLMLAFATGYGIGRLVPEPRLRRWIGPELWDKTRRQARQQAWWWLVAARPLPLLAEMSALLAGVWRMPFLPAFAHAAAAASVVATLYVGSAWLGRGQPGMAITLLAMLALPSMTWALHRLLVRRIMHAIHSEASTAIGKEEP